MVVTRTQTSAVAAASNSSSKVDKAPKTSGRSRPLCRTLQRSPPFSSPNPIHRLRSQLSKIIVCNNNVNETKSFNHFQTNTRGRSPSYDSSSTSSINISRTSSSDSSSSSTSSISTSSSSSSNFSSGSSINTSRSSSSSSTKSSSLSDYPISTCRTISSMTENLNKMKINDYNNCFLSANSPSSQQSNRLPRSGPIVVYKSTKNGNHLCLHGYTYQIDVRLQNRIKWKCKHSRDKTRCRTKIYTTENVGTDEMPAYQYIQSNNVEHAHDEESNQQKIEIFKSQVKKIGRDNRTLPSSKIINQLATSMKLTNSQLGMIPRQRTLYQSIYRARSETMPPLPKSIDFDIPAAFSTTSSDEKFVFFDHLYSKRTKRIIAFASPMQLKKLFSAKLICVDGTFSICPRKHKQLLIIQTIDEEKYDATPVVYALLNDKKAYTYQLLFQALIQMAKEMKMKFKPDRIISDFESGMISTIKTQLPHTVHQGCLFHLYQSLVKKMKKFGLWVYYKIDEELHLFMKKVMAIVLLKPTLMNDAYLLLTNQYLKMKQLKPFNRQIKKFMHYFNKQWMKSDVRAMITFYEVYFKTNNWSESYNAALQRRAQRSHLSIWTLIELLITEETAVRMRHFQMKNGKGKYINTTIRNSVIEMNEKIIELNRKLEDGEIKLADCLSSLSILVGAKYDKWRQERKKNKGKAKKNRKREKCVNVDD